MDTGHALTSKDKELLRKEVEYLQNQVNNNVWWLSEILGYSCKKTKDKERMQENLLDHGMEVPPMKVLIKNHKDRKF